MSRTIESKSGNIVVTSRARDIRISQETGGPCVITIQPQHVTTVDGKIVESKDTVQQHQVIADDRNDQVVEVKGVKLTLAEILAFVNQFADDIDEELDK